MAEHDSDSIPDLVRSYEQHLRTGGSQTPEEFLKTVPGASEKAIPALEIVRGLKGTDEVIGPYKLVHELGRGAQATVYLAEDTRLGRKVALKLLALGRDVESYLRFQREAESASRLDHPDICTIYEAGVADGVPYLAMRYVDGAPLADGGEPVDAKLARIERVARALHAAHEAGLVHRDIKPGNIMVTHGGDPVLCDFGLARDTGHDHAALTRTGEARGTPAYMSPEQLLGKPLDRRSDVFSLGVVLYEYLTGGRPFEAATLDDLYRRILQSEPPPTRLPRDVRIVLQTALDKDRNRRYATALDFAEDLRRVRGGEPVRARPPSVWRRARRFAQRHPAATVAFLLVVAGVLIFFRQQRQALEEVRAERDVAEWRTYTANIFAADASLDSDKPGAAHPRLEACDEALRGWEWRYLKHKSDTSLAIYRAPVATLRGVALRPDGKQLAACSEQGVVVLWDVGRSEHVAALRGHTHRRVRTVTYSPDGSLLVSGGNDRTVRLWDPNTYKLLHTLTGHASSVHGIVFSADGSRMYTASFDRTVRVWDVATRRSLRRLVYDKPVTALALADADTIVVGFERGGCAVTDLASGVTEPLGETEGATVESVVAHPTRGLAAVCAQNGTTYVYDIAGRRRVGWLLGHRGFCTGAAFLEGGRIVTTSRDASIRTWTLAGRPESTQIGHRRPISGFALAPGGRAYTSSFDGTVRLWSLAPRTAATVLQHPHIVNALSFSPDGQHLAVGGWGFVVRIYDVASGEVDLVLRGHRSRIRALDYSPDGALIATGSTDRSIRLWDARSGEMTAELKGHTNVIGCVAFSPGGTRLASCATDRTVRVWDVAARRPRHVVTHTAPFSRVAFAPDGRRIAATSSDGTVRVYDLESGEPALVLQGSGTGLRGVTFHPDGRRIVAGALGGEILVWDAATGARTGVLEGHASHVNAVTFIPGGTRLVSASHDTTVRLWDLDRGDAVLMLRGHEALITAVSVSSDGRRIASSGHDRSIRMWESAPPEQFRALQARRAESRARAQPIVDGLFEELGFSLDVIGRLRSAPGLDGELRRTAIRMAHAREENPRELRQTAWEIVLRPDRAHAEYERARTLAERALRLSNAPSLQPALAAAALRLGRHDRALDVLEEHLAVMAQLRFAPRPTTQAVLALALHGHGEADAARKTLAALEKRARRPEYRDDTNLRALLDEARALIR